MQGHQVNSYWVCNFPSIITFDMKECFVYHRNMDVEPSMATIGAMIGSPARSAMLAELFDGRAITATELSQIANISPSTCSEHLSKLVQSGLLVCNQHGRHRYYSLSSSEVAEALEPLVHLVGLKPIPMRTASPQKKAIRDARLCYDHIAGKLGVQICNAMVDQKILTPASRDFELTKNGERFFEGLGIDLAEIRSNRRMFARQCLDWSERKPHVAGALGAAFTNHSFKQGWIIRAKQRRVVVVTPKGKQAFFKRLGVMV